MNRVKRVAIWDERIRAAFASRYGPWPCALAYYTGVWAAHLEAGLADAELVSALTGGDEGAGRQRI